jgi:hypothetical protein
MGASSTHPVFGSKAGPEAVAMLRGQLRVSADAAQALLARAAGDGAGTPREVELVAETRIHTPDCPAGAFAGASRWVLAYNRERTQVKLTRVEAQVQPRTPAKQEAQSA